MLSKTYRMVIVLFVALLVGGLAVIALPETGTLPTTAYATGNLPPAVVITRPVVSEIITPASVPTYPVLVEVTPNCGTGTMGGTMGSGCLPNGSLLLTGTVTLTIRSLSTGEIVSLTQQPSAITQTQVLTFDWALPITRNVQFVLTAEARNGQPTVGTSDPVTVTVNTMHTIFLPLVMKRYAPARSAFIR